MWLTVNEGSIEFLTPGNSYKLKRVRREPSGCVLGRQQ